MDVGELPEASVNAVDDLAARDNFLNYPTRGMNRRMRARRDRHFFAGAGDARYFREGKRPAVEL